jgi:hypothetical protein
MVIRPVVPFLVSWASLASLEALQIPYTQIQSHRLKHTCRMQGLIHKWITHNCTITEHAISSEWHPITAPSLLLPSKASGWGFFWKACPGGKSSHKEKELKFLGSLSVQYTHTHKSWPKNSFSLERDLTGDVSVPCHNDRMRAQITRSSHELNLLHWSTPRPPV